MFALVYNMLIVYGNMWKEENVCVEQDKQHTHTHKHKHILTNKYTHLVSITTHHTLNRNIDTPHTTGTDTHRTRTYRHTQNTHTHFKSQSQLQVIFTASSLYI